MSPSRRGEQGARGVCPARGFPGCVQGDADFREAALLEVPQHQGVAIGADELVQSVVEQWTDLFPIRRGFRLKSIHGDSVLFTPSAPLFRTKRLRRRITGGAVQPAS